MSSSALPQASSKGAGAVSDMLSADVSLAQQGDMQAYARLIKNCQNVVTAIALAIVKDIDDSEEVAQQVFISAWQNLNKLKNSSSFLPWIRQSTRYTAFNFLRDNKSSARLNTEQAEVILAQIADPSLSHDDTLIIKNQNLVLQQLIDQLAQEDREIVLLYYREEQSSKQVAELLNLSQSNVRQKLSRVRQSLQTDVLKRASHLLYSTAPAVGFSVLISSLLVPAAPVAAATLAATSASSNASSSVILKIATVLGGAFLGAFVAIFAIVWSSNTAMKNVPNEDKKLVLKQYRNETIAWVVVFAISISLAYQFTQGWIGPMLAYLGFVIGLVALSLRQISFINKHAMLLKKGQRVAPSRLDRFFSYACLTLGVVTGFGGLILGLISSGRLVL
jgi:RNA polymerase sigma factor (sigma-70 family)